MGKERVSLRSREAFATGNNRACYRLEEFPGKCLKVLRSDLPAEAGKGAGREGEDDNAEEYRLLRSLHRRLGPSAREIFPTCDGFVETDLGPALVTELCTDFDGTISLTLDHVLARGLFNEAMAASLERFKRTWVRAGIRSRQLRLHNLVVQQVQPGDYRIRVIDGLGRKGGTFPRPLHLLLWWKARKKMRGLEDRIARFRAMPPEEQSSRMREIRSEKPGAGS